jgi:hypothetical protein
MKRTQIFLIVIAVAMLGLYLYERHQRIELAETVESLQAALDQAADDHAEQVARMRFELEEQLEQRRGIDAVQAMSDLQGTLRDQRLRARNQAIHEAAVVLELDDDAEQVLKSVISRFEGGKRGLISQHRADGTFLSESHLEQVDDLRLQVLAVLAETFSDQQFELFFSRGFAERLDLEG